jgi:hypothetical protein
MNRVLNELRIALGRALRLSLEMHSLKLFIVVCGLGVMIVAPAVRGQKLPTPAPSGRKPPNLAKSILTALASPPVLQEQIPQQAPAPLSAELGTPSRHQVSYEDGQLTIVAENSKLGDILAAVSERMGADIELPASASDERIWVRLGPGPARRVLAALLGGTDLDYVIQASETDPEGIQSVLLTLRTKAAAVVASGRPASSAGQARVPNRRNLQPNRSPAEVSGGENSAEPATPGVEVPTAGSPPASTEQQPAAAELQASPGTTDADADKSAPKTSEQMIQKLQNMYQQRKQMQQDRKPPSPN